MEQTTLKDAAKAFADAQEKETAARDYHAHCQSLVEKSMNDSVQASTARRAAERQLLMAASAVGTEAQQPSHTDNQPRADDEK